MTRLHDEALVEAVARAIAIANHIHPDERTPETNETFLRDDLRWFTQPEDLEDFDVETIEHYRHLATEALSAMEAARGVEYGIMRISQTPDMSGAPLYVQTTASTFPSLKTVENALKYVPHLQGVPAIICERTPPGPWRPVKQEAER